MSGNVTTLCLRGHPIAPERASVFCPMCGARVISGCPRCGRAIHLPVDDAVPAFCSACGAAFPWVSREARIYELMNLLDHEDLDPAAELEVREQLDALRDPELAGAVQEDRWHRIKRAAPSFWEKSGAQEIITTLILAEARVRLGLPAA